MPQLILIGSRGAGKTSVGAALAARLGTTFVDLDDRAIALGGGGSIRELIAREGEAAWRGLERRAFVDAMQGPSVPAILALGGGAVTVAEIRDGLVRLRAAGSVRVVWLRAPVATLIERLRADPGDRGSLTGRGLLEELQALLAAREPLYSGLSNLAVDTGGRTVAEVTDELLAWLAAPQPLS
jgi:shikimate kinase